MNHDILRAFLADCKAHPFDDTPRLILADWLEEHGDSDADRARGEFVRAQVWAANLPEHNPRRRALDAQAKELDRQYRQVWLGRVADLDDGAHLERGLVAATVDSARLFQRMAAGLGEHPAWEWVESLRLGNDRGRDIPPSVWELPALASLGELHVEIPFGTGATTAVPLFASPHLRRLAALRLEGNVVSRDNLAALIAWPGLATLQALAFERVPLGDHGVSALLWSSGLTALRRLEVTFANLTATSVRALGRCPRLEGLEALTLSQNAIEGPNLPTPRGLAFAASLKRLALHGNRLGGEGARALAAGDLPALRSLGLGSCELSPKAALALSRAPWLRRLEHLWLSGNPLRAGAEQLLAAPLADLRALHLGGCGLDARAVAVLAASRHLPRLEELHLGGNPLGRDGVEALRLGRGLPALRVLDLGETQLGDDGMKLLAGWPGLGQLYRLDADGCDATDAGLRALLHSPHLGDHVALDLTGNQASPALAEHVRGLGRPITL